MFQFMFATVIARRVPSLKICGLDIPEWGIADDADGLRLVNQNFARTIRLTGHRLDIDAVVWQLQKNLVECVEYDGWACRVGYYGKPEEFRDYFPTPDGLKCVGFPDDTLLVNVRAGEIVAGAHRDYIPTPTSLIQHVVENTGLTPVFMGQLGEDWYSNSLRKTFPKSDFVPSRGPIHDFEAIRQTKNVLIPVSTFSWLACWLSERCTNIHMPLLGMFNPLQRSDVDLAPLQDDRYTFYSFPRVRWRGEKENLELLKFTEVGPGSILMRKFLGRFFNGADRARRVLAR